MRGALMRDGISTGDRVLVEGLYPSLRRFAALVAPWDLDPDDVLQEALVRVLTRRQLSSLEHPAAYLRRTITNLVKDERRRSRSQTRAMVTIGVADPAADLYPSDLAGLGELSPAGRAALYMAEVEGFSYAEIGSALGCSEVAARMASMRARRQLRQIIESEASDEH